MKSSLAAAEVNPSIRMSMQTFRRIAEFVRRETGIQMPESKVTMIQARLGSRVRELELESIDEYCEYLFSPAAGEPERVYLINAMATNKTGFFREPQHFKYLTATVLPELAKTRKSTITVWSAACSSGEEPFTLAMVLADYAVTHPGFTFRIFGTDISTKVLDQCRSGIYSREQVALIPPEMQRRHLAAGDCKDNFRFQASLRQAISFRQLNLMSADYGVHEFFDVILCRNVLIYFDPPTKEAVINKLCRNLNPGGYLFIGHTESLTGLKVPVVPDSPACFRKRP